MQNAHQLLYLGGSAVAGMMMMMMMMMIIIIIMAHDREQVYVDFLRLCLGLLTPSQLFFMTHGKSQRILTKLTSMNKSCIEANLDT